jgi:hypothetical protein
VKSYEARKHAANLRKRRHARRGLTCDRCGNAQAMELHRRDDMLVCTRCRYKPRSQA